MITLRNVLVIFAVLVVGTLTIIINNVQFAILGCFVWLNSSVLFFFFSGWGGFPPPILYAGFNKILSNHIIDDCKKPLP